MQGTRGWLRRIVTIVVSAGLGGAIGARGAAHADVDLNGSWDGYAVILFFPQNLDCTLEFVQTGTSLTASGECAVVGAIDLTGTIDTVTGSFDAAGTAGPACPTLTVTNGNASLDGRTFLAPFQCSGGPLPALGSVYGFRCGNGVIDVAAGENCEDGNRQGGDCCSSICQFDPPGAFCSNDGNQCTDEACDGAGTCLHPNRTGPCDDGNQCTAPDECVDGSCVGTALPDDSACNDFNDCTTETCQAGTCTAANLSDGTPCNDFYDCTAGEVCQSGQCAIGAPLACPACERCYEGQGCVPERFGYVCAYGSKDALLVKDRVPDLARWTWVSNQEVTLADLGDAANATWEFCIFDEFGIDPESGDSPRLLFGAYVPAGAGWKETASGFRYRGSDKLEVRLKAGPAGRAKVSFQVKDAAHVVQYLPPEDELLGVRLRTGEGVSPPVCFGADYFPPWKSTADKLKGKNPNSP
jgi:cysteine-rich repeat protein